MADSFQSSGSQCKLCVRVCFYVGLVSYLRLESNSENVLPFRGVLHLKSQCSELGVNEKQPDDVDTNTHTINQYP